MNIISEYAYARNVEHCYTDPKDGKFKIKKFKDGKLADVQAEINEFIKSLNDSKSVQQQVGE